MRKLLLLTVILAMCACVLAGCRNQGNNTTVPSSSTPSSPSTTAPTTAPHIAPNPSTTPSTGVLPDIGEDLMPGTDATTAPHGDMARTRPAPRY